MNPATSDNLRKKAGEAIRAIASALYDTHTDDFSLMYGNTGIALFLFHYWQWRKQNSFYKKAAELINRVFVDLSKQIHLNMQHDTLPVDLSFSSGLCGIGWALDYLTKNEFIECDMQESMCMIDAAIYRNMVHGLYSEDQKEIKEAMAAGIYAVNRDDRLSKEYLRRFVNEWTTLTVSNRHSTFINFIRENSETATFLRNRITEKYPDIIPLSANNIPRTAGENHACTDSEIQFFQEQIPTLTVCSGLARGLAATGYRLNRKYRQTGIAEFRSMAETCFTTLLERMSLNKSDFWFTASQGLWRRHDGLANGIAGIGMALLTIVTDEILAWDECLFVL